jgi:YVTN family beta-propeller protein
VTQGVYVLNEGNYGDPTGARLSLYDITKDSNYTDLFEAANQGAHLGSTGDDIQIFRDRLYLLMSGSENVVVIRTSDHKLLAEVTFPGWVPHTLLLDTLRSRAYLTRLFRNSIGILDLTTLAVLDTVPVGANPQDMALAGTNLFVANSGYGADKTVSVLDVVSGTVIKTIPLSDGPTGVVIGADGKVWVACTGNAYGSPATNGRVYRIHPQSLSVEDSILFTGQLFGPLAASPEGYIYVLGVSPGSYFGGPVHRISVTTRSVTAGFLAGTFYALAVDQQSGDVYAADAKSFSAAGEVKRFDKNGALRGSFTAQRGPGAFAFKR